MDLNFAKYLREFLKRYGIESNEIDFDQVSDYQSLEKQAKSSNVDLSAVSLSLKVIFYLHKNEIYIYQDEYKSSKKYMAIKDEWLPYINDSIMSAENYVEHFLVDRLSLIDLYEQESIYAMGNPYELDDAECQLAKTLKKENSLFIDNKETQNNSNELVLEDLSQISQAMKDVDPEFVKMLIREDSWSSCKSKKAGGLLIRLCRDLQFDIEAFSPQKEYRADICKIIYFLIALEHTAIIPSMQKKEYKPKGEKKNEQYFNLTDFLSKPSMESTGVKFLRDTKNKRFNGKITDYIKNELEKEINLKEETISEIEYLRTEFKHIVGKWVGLFSNVRKAVDTNQKIDFDKIIYTCDSIEPLFHSFEEIFSRYGYQNPISEPSVQTSDNPYSFSPIVALYFRILQFELSGEIEDRQTINRIKIDSDYNVPKDFIEKMRTYKDQFIERAKVEKHIRKHIDRLAECVYMKLDIDSEKMQKLKYRIKDVLAILDCCIYAKKILQSENEISELLIISCLQAILLDKDDADNEYVFYDYQHHLKSSHIPKISSIPKNDANHPTISIQKLYWAQRVEAHLYANIGQYALYCKSRTVEKYLYWMLTHMCSTDNIEEMKRYSEECYEKLEPFFEIYSPNVG